MVLMGVTGCAMMSEQLQLSRLFLQICFLMGVQVKESI